MKKGAYESCGLSLKQVNKDKAVHRHMKAKERSLSEVQPFRRELFFKCSPTFSYDSPLLFRAVFRLELPSWNVQGAYSLFGLVNGEGSPVVEAALAVSGNLPEVKELDPQTTWILQ